MDEGDEPISLLHQHHWSIFSNFSWAHPVSNKTCWEKAHEFYIPQGLFSTPKMKREMIDDRLVFDSGNLKTNNELFIKQKVARGEKINKRKAIEKRKNPPVVAETEAVNETVAVTQESDITNDSVEPEEFVTVEL